MIQQWLTGAVGLIAGGSVLFISMGLILSVPVVLWLSLQVLFRREWIPAIYTLRSLAQRKVTTAATLVGLTLVIFVLTSVLMLAAGIQHTLTATGSPSNVKVFRKNVWAEGQGWLTGEQVQLLSAAAEVARTAEGEPRLSPEALVLVWAAHANPRDANDGANLTVRGVTPAAFGLHPPRTLEGRRFNPGTDEIIIGRGLVGRFEGATLGGAMSFAGRDWQVVGVADQFGAAHDSEIWTDLDQVGVTFRRGVASVTLALNEPASFAPLAERIAADPRLSELEPRREIEYWRSLGGNYTEFIRLLGGVVGLIFSFGAILGAMNTMYAQVTARTRELGTLRAIGFKPRAILVSLVFESMLIALVAGALGVAAASVLQAFQFRLTTVKTLTEIIYGFHLSPGLALLCLSFAALMGYAGGLLPALRASRMRIVDAVRAD